MKWVFELLPVVTDERVKSKVVIERHNAIRNDCLVTLFHCL